MRYNVGMNSRRLTVLLVTVSVFELAFIVHLVSSRAPSASKDLPKKDTKPSSHDIKTIEKTVTNRFDWRSVESSDYRAYITNLRSIGCPEETVRDIIIADIEKMLAAKQHAVADAKSDGRNFWEPEPDDTTDLLAGEKVAEQEAIEKEKQRIVKDLLGIDLAVEKKKLTSEQNFVDRRLRFLPAEKRATVAAILERFNEQELRLQRAGAETANKSDYGENLNKLRAQKEMDLSAVLSPTEKQLLEYWTSSLGISTRHSLGALEKPTEQEFIAIYNLRKEYERQYGADVVDLNDPIIRAQAELESEQLENRIRAALGENRYTEYTRGKDTDFRVFTELAHHFDLPSTTATKVYDLKKSVDQQLTKLTATETITDEQRLALSQQVRIDAGTKLRELLGERAFTFYRRNGEAGWFEIR